jgi:hypothetical protein
MYSNSRGEIAAQNRVTLAPGDEGRKSQAFGGHHFARR